LKRLDDTLIHKKVVAEMINDMKRRKRDHFTYAVVAHCDGDSTLNGKNIEQINITKGRPSTIPDEIETILGYCKDRQRLNGVSWHERRRCGKYYAVPLTMIISDSGIRQFGQGAPHPRGYAAMRGYWAVT